MVCLILRLRKWKMMVVQVALVRFNKRPGNLEK